MVSKLRSWWQNRPLLVVGTIVLLVGLVALIFAGYWFKWDWTGFNEHTGPNVLQYQPVKTLWDWLQLLGVLAIPVAVALGTAWFTMQQARISDANREEQHKTELEIAQKRHDSDLEIASNNQHEAALQAYIDKMSELLLASHLRDSAEDEEVQKIARVRTLTVLRRLDAERKGSVLRFLYESALIEKDTRIIELSQADLSLADLYHATLDYADLSHADLSRANLYHASLKGAGLSHANLSFANLSFADLSRADLHDADLSNANLSSAVLSEAILSGAILSGASVTPEQLSKARLIKDTIMPDGLKHP